MATKNTDSGYLDKLTFDPKLEGSFLAKYITNIRVIALLIVSILTIGIFSFNTLSRRVNPEINIPIVFVSTVLPGASPSDIESLVTVPLEDEIESVSNVTKISSQSRDNVSTIQVEFSSSVDTEKAKTDVQNAIDQVTDLPEDAMQPFVASIDFEDIPVWTFAVTTEKELPSLYRFSDILEQRLESGSYINKVNVSGKEVREIQILMAPEKVDELGFNPLFIINAIRTELDAFPAGIVTAHGSELSLTIDPLITNLDELREVRIDLQGNVYKLGDIAEVSEKPAPQQTTSYLASNDSEAQKVVAFSVYKLKSADIDKTALQAHEIVNKTLEEFDNQYSIVSFTDEGENIDEQFTDLFQNLSATIALVFLTLFAFLGIKQASIASLTIPLTFLIAFGSMLATGLSLNFLSLFSLILALGLVVDDTIVVIAAMTSYFKTGKFTTTQTGLLVWNDFIVPIWTTTLTTVWAFLPLLLASGIIGEFIKTIPIVVSSVLLSSTSVAVFITLPLMIVVLNPHIPKRTIIFFRVIGGIVGLVVLISIFKENPLALLIVPICMGAALYIIKYHNTLRDHIQMLLDKVIDGKQLFKDMHRVFYHGFIDPKKLSVRYEKLILRILKSQRSRRRTVAIVTGFFIFSVLLIPLGFVKNEFFPKTDQKVLYMSLELPSGTTSDITDAEMKRLTNEVRHTADVEDVVAELGVSIGSGSTTTETSSNIARFTLNLVDESTRKRSSIEIADELREKFKGYDKGELQIVEESGGPPVGADIVVNLLGDDLGELDDLGTQLVEYMKQQDGLTNIQKSIKPGVSKLSFVPDREKISDVGLSTSDIRQSLRTFSSGLTIDQSKLTTRDNIDIVFRLSEDLQTPESLSALQIQTANGPVPLLSLGNIELRTKPTVINREDGKRILSVTAAVEQGYNIPELNAGITAHVEEMNFPEGYEWSTGGVNEENTKSVQSILQAMILAFILIFGTMVIQLSSFRKSLIVLLVIPLAMSGVFIVFAVTGIPLSFPALIGVLALYGIVVNNSIVVVEKINQNLKIGIPFTHAVADASASRLEPIMFSSLTTLIGLLPITISDPLWRGLGGAIIAGLTFSGTVMLLFIPVMYYILFEKSENKKSESSS